MVQRAVAELGRIDILVNCAGIGPLYPLVDFPVDVWRKVLEVNLTGYFLMGRWVFLLHEHLAASSGALARPGPIRTLVKTVTYCVPDLQVFNTSRELSLGIAVPLDYMMASAGYAVAFVVVFLVIAIALFSRRDFV